MTKVTKVTKEPSPRIPIRAKADNRGLMPLDGCNRARCIPQRGRTFAPEALSWELQMRPTAAVADRRRDRARAVGFWF